MYLSCFWAYVRQPHNHIGWAKPMPFTLLNSTNRRTNLSNFHEKTLRIGGAGKWGFFRVGHYLIFFFFKKEKVFFASSQWKQAAPLYLVRIIYFYTMAGFFRILEKTSSELICTQLYLSKSCNAVLGKRKTLLLTIYSTSNKKGGRYLWPHSTITWIYNDLAVFCKKNSNNNFT